MTPESKQLTTQLPNKNIIIITMICLTCGVIFSLIGFHIISTNLIDSQALQQSKAMAVVLNKSRIYYSENVVGPINKNDDIIVTNNYHLQNNAIPNPATFTIELGEALNAHDMSTDFRLYSDHPFPSRIETGGARDVFEQEALAHLKIKPGTSYSRRDNSSGEMTFRYAEAVLMQASCIACHNSLVNSPKTDWQVGDVRGVLSITQDIDKLVQRSHKETNKLAMSQAVMVILILLILLAVIKHIKSLNTFIADRVNQRTARLKILASTDSLTQLANRREFDIDLDYQFKKMQRQESQLSLIMIDIDHFKPYNDTLGHQQGDTCLRSVADVIKTAFRQEDMPPYRYGGEEFIIILPNSDSEKAMAAGQRLLNNIAALNIPHPSSPTHDTLTVSIGIVNQQENTHSSPEELLNMVDEALYLAKSQGRNQIAVYTTR